jgi:pimeloyl-ACP methyl ester carboxylesterase
MTRDYVVLLHGILRSKTDMLPLAAYLKKNGYDVLNILYPSRKKSLEDLVEYIDDKIRRDKNYSPEKTLHFVTHSMGGLIARYYIIRNRPPKLGKVVMLGPPNTGSEFADFLKDHKLFSPAFRAAFGPAGQQLDTKHRHLDGAIDYPLGVIAGNRSINPLAPWMMPKKLVGEHDGIVPVERTKIDGMADHIVVRSTHTFMMFRPNVMKQVRYFLENGKFRR